MSCVVSLPSYFVCIRVRDAEVVRNVARIQDEVTDHLLGCAALIRA